MEENNPLANLNPDVIKTVARNIAGELINKGLSYRQALALLDYTKDLLQDAKITS